MAVRTAYQVSPGLLVHDWGDSAAVVFVAGMGTTHLIDGSVAAALAAWDDASPDDDEALDAALAPHIDALVQTGILQERPGR